MDKEYKQLKEITMEALSKEGACEGEWSDWLIEHGFIEERVLYAHAGQRYSFGGREYVLAYIGGKGAALVNVESGWTWSGVKPIQCSDRITPAEFKTVCGGNDFKLVGK